MKSFRYLALGDSYTIGERVALQDNFPHQLVSMLKQHGLQVEEPVIIAQTGWTTDELSAAIDSSRIQPPYDLVSLLIGVNNQYRGRSVADYEPDFEQLLRRAITLAGNQPSRVVVFSIPDWGVTPFAADRDRIKIAREIDAYNSSNRRIAGKFEVHYIDITGSTRQAADDVSLLADDGLHPSAREYAKWARLAVPVILGCFSNGGK